MTRSWWVGVAVATVALSACGSATRGIAETEARVSTSNTAGTADGETATTAEAGGGEATPTTERTTTTQRTTTTRRTATTEASPPTTEPLSVVASLAVCDVNFRCTYSFSGSGASPSSRLELVIVDGSGADIQVLPGFSYATDYTADGAGGFSATDFATTLDAPDVHEFSFRDVATGRIASASIRFQHPPPLEAMQVTSSRSRCPHQDGCSYELTVRGLTPRGALKLVIRDGKGVDINTLPGYRYSTDWVADDTGSLATGTFRTATALPEAHTFEFADEATGNRASAVLVFE